MPSLIVAALAFLAPSATRGEAPSPELTVQIVTTDGKPAVGAKAWVVKYVPAVKIEPEPIPLVAGADGKLVVADEKDAEETVRYLFVRDSQGRIGSAHLSHRWIYGEENDQQIKVVLIELAEREGTIVDSSGKPIAGAAVVPKSYYLEAKTVKGSQELPSSISFPKWENERYIVKTDAAGRFKVKAPANYSMTYSVQAAGYGASRWDAKPGIALDMMLVMPGSATITAAGFPAAKLKGTTIALQYRDKLEERQAITLYRHFSATFDESGTATIEDIAPGTYELSFNSHGVLPGWLEKSPPFEIVSRQRAALTAQFGPTTQVTGQVNDQKTGQGIAGATVYVSVGDGQSTKSKVNLFVKTDAEGKFVAYGPAGWYSLWIQNPPAGYATPPPVSSRNRGGNRGEGVKLEVGKSHAFPPLELLKTVTFRGRVVTADDKPAAGAKYFDGGFSMLRRQEKVTADQDGNFTIKDLPPDDAIAPHVRLGKAVNVVEEFELEKATGPVTLVVSEANAAGFKGQVVDARGKPVANAKVDLLHELKGVGRNAGFFQRHPRETTTTNAEGRYTFEGLWPNDRYYIQVKADGYTEAQTQVIIGVAGEITAIADIKIRKSNFGIVGMVVGSDGQPIAGAEVFSVDSEVRIATQSQADGRFSLTGFTTSAAYVFAKKAGYRLTAVPVFAAEPNRVTISLLSVAAPPPPAPVITAEHHQALDQLTRHVLKRIWDVRDQFGYGSHVLADLACIDLATAKKWNEEEKKRTGGKKDYKRQIESAELRKTLLPTALSDIDEAVAILEGLSQEDGFHEAIRVGEQLLKVDKEKALRFAEVAVLKARQLELPQKIWSLAEAGDLAARAGGAGGKKVLAEAAELAQKLPAEPNSRESLAVGLVGASLARHDWPAAEAILNSLKDPGDYNRYLAAAAVRLATTNLELAKKLFNSFKPANTFYPSTGRLRVAFAIAGDKPEEALKLVESTEERYYRVEGLIHLAVLFAPTDKARAVKMIDSAFALLEREPEQFLSWSAFGGRAGLAALATVRAREIGHPDVALLLARTLAMRSPRQSLGAARDQDDTIIGLATVLARVDPAVAMHLLSAVAPPEEFVSHGMSQGREYLFALALADPVQATVLADKLIERAKAKPNGQNGLSETGLVELGSILSAPDLLNKLGIFSHTARDVEIDD